MTMDLSPESAGARVGFLLIGGTIASTRTSDGVVGKGGDRTLGMLAAALPGASDPDLVYRVVMNIASESMVPEDWEVIADQVVSLVEETGLDGVVLLHGTDTAAYTAAGLSFLLAGCRYPVVITGALRPVGQRYSDAGANIREAVIAAGSLSGGVYVSFHGVVHLGTNARKVQGSPKRYRFASINRQPVAIIHGGHLTVMDPAPVCPATPAVYARRMDRRVLLLQLFPGLDFDLFVPMLGSLRGVVLELYASATASDREGSFSVPRFVTKCDAAGVVVVGTHAGAEGAAPRGRRDIYESTVALRSAGTLIMDDILPETAVAKMMWALAQSDDVETVREWMRTPIAGEFLLAGDDRSAL